MIKCEMDDVKSEVLIASEVNGIFLCYQPWQLVKNY